VAGADITVVQGGGRAPIMLALGGSRLLLDARSAQLVSVSPCETPADKSGVRP
jgi:Fe2+ transport system protein FeoA